MSDTGPYTCEVVNGFGVRKINVTIFVVPDDTKAIADEISSIANYPLIINGGGRLKDGEEDDDVDEEDSERINLDQQQDPKRRRTKNEESKGRKNNGHPYLIKTLSWNAVTKFIGESAKFECSALGHPTPTIRWMYNDLPIDVAILPADSIVQGGHLYIPKVTLKSMGKYTCVAFNELGQDSADFELTVKGREASFDFVETYPLESYEVQEGSSITIKCRVRSSVKPRIEWLRKDLILKEEKQQQQVRQALKQVSLESQNHLQEESRLNLWIEPRSDLILIGDNVYERSITIRSAELSDEGDYICTCFIGKQFKYKSTILIVSPLEDVYNESFPVNFNETSLETFGTLFPPIFLWIFCSIFLITLTILFFFINWRTRTRVETFAANTIEMGKPGDPRSKSGQIIEGSIDAFGDPINREHVGRPLNTYTLINHRPQNYYWTRGRLDAWIDDSDKYTAYRKPKCQHVCRSCNKSLSNHSKRRKSSESDHAVRTSRRTGSEGRCEMYSKLRKHEDVRRQKQRLEQVAQVQSNLRHDYSAIKYSMNEHEVMIAAPNNSPESNNS